MTCRWNIIAPAVAAGVTGAAALVLGVVLKPTPSTHLLITYLVTAAALGVITALVVWAVESFREGQDAVRAEIRAATERVHSEVRAGNAYENLIAIMRTDPPSRPTHLRSVKPS